MNSRKFGRMLLAVAMLTPLVARASYFSQVMSHSPLLYYRLGEASGPTAYDSSGNGYHGTPRILFMARPALCP